MTRGSNKPGDDGALYVIFLTTLLNRTCIRVGGVGTKLVVFLQKLIGRIASLLDHGTTLARSFGSCNVLAALIVTLVTFGTNRGRRSAAMQKVARRTDTVTRYVSNVNWQSLAKR